MENDDDSVIFVLAKKPPAERTPTSFVELNSTASEQNTQKDLETTTGDDDSITYSEFLDDSLLSTSSLRPVSELSTTDNSITYQNVSSEHSYSELESTLKGSYIDISSEERDSDFGSSDFGTTEEESTVLANL